MSDVTQILSQIEAGDGQAAEKLLPLVYDELRKLAAEAMRRISPACITAVSVSYASRRSGSCWPDQIPN